MSNNVNVLALATISTRLSPESIAWREAAATAAGAWAKVARVHRRIGKLYAERDTNLRVESDAPVTDREEAFSARMHAISAEIRALENISPLLRDNAEIAEEAVKAALEAAAT